MTQPYIDLGPIDVNGLAFQRRTSFAWWGKRHTLGSVDGLLRRVETVCPAHRSHLIDFRKVLVSWNRKTGRHVDSVLGYTLVVFVEPPVKGGELELIDEKLFLKPEKPWAYLVDTTRPHRAWRADGGRLVVCYYRPRNPYTVAAIVPAPG